MFDIKNLPNLPKSMQDQISREVKKRQDEATARKATYKALYPWILEDTMKYNPDTRKIEVDLPCQNPKCGKTHTRATSDLHQCTLCPVCKVLADREKAKTKRDFVREAMKSVLAQ